MSFRIVTGRDRRVRRVVLAAATAGITALGVVTLPLDASAAPVTEAAAAADQREHDTVDRKHPGPDSRDDRADDDTTPGGPDARTPGETLDPRFAPSAEAAITPGVELLTDLGNGVASCTANFVYTSGESVYLGSAAHCASTSLATSLNGCENDSLPLGTEVIIRGLDGVDYTGTLAYSSWLTMMAVGETDEDECLYNDISLIEIDADDVGRVNPSVPVFGGPEGLDTDGVAVGERVFSYQNTREDPPFAVMRAKQGVNRENLGDGRRHNVATTTPGFSGDSGSGYLDADGDAFGVLSTVFSEGGEIRNGVSNLASALRYAVANTDFDEITVESGTVPFSVEEVDMGPMPALPGISALPGLPALPAAPGGLTLPLIG